MTTISGEGDCDAATQRVAVFGASGGIRAAPVAALAAPFQRGVPAERLFPPEPAAAPLLDVLAVLTPADSGGLFGWDGARIAF